jgi:hypothetical protein
MATRQTPNPQNLRDRLLDHFSVLRIPITPGQFDAVMARAEREHLSHLEFLEALIGEQANQRRERSIQYRTRLPFENPRAWKPSTGSSTPPPSIACRSRNWPPATSSAARTTSSWWANPA